MASKNRFPDLPLLVVSRSDGTITRSFEQAFVASELEKLAVGPEEITFPLPIYWSHYCPATAVWWIVIRREDGLLSPPIQLGLGPTVSLERSLHPFISSGNALRHTPYMYAISSLAYMYAVSSDGTPIIQGQSGNFEDQTFTLSRIVSNDGKPYIQGHENGDGLKELKQPVVFKKYELQRRIVKDKDSWTFSLECQ